MNRSTSCIFYLLKYRCLVGVVIYEKMFNDKEKCKKKQFESVLSSFFYLAGYKFANRDVL